MSILLIDVSFAASGAFENSLFLVAYCCCSFAISSGIGVAIFSGLTPVIESYLYSKIGSFTSISIWLSSVGLITLVSKILIPKN